MLQVCLIRVGAKLSRTPALQSPIRTVIVSHMDVYKNEFTYQLSDKTHGFGWRFIHSERSISALLTWQVTWLFAVNKIHFIYELILTNAYYFVFKKNTYVKCILIIPSIF